MSQTMNPDIKAEWIAALRDPEAKQTTGVLNRIAEGVEDFERGRPVGNCCLGVLCEIAVKHGVTERGEPDEGRGVVGYRDGDYFETGVLPTAVRNWSGLTDFNPDVLTSDGSMSTLATLNDRGMSFADLADLIDAQL